MMIEMLNILNQFDLGAMGHNSADYIATVAEAMKYAVDAGRLAYKAGRIPRKLYATASSPIEGML